MKMYEFFNVGKKIGRDEFEVVEKLSSYERTDKTSNKKRIRKNEINVLNVGYSSFSMYSLDSNPEQFIKLVLAHKKTELEKMEVAIAKQRNEIIALSVEFKGYISENTRDGKYFADGELSFEITDDGMATGTPVSDATTEDNVDTLYNGVEFSDAINTEALHGHINMIYVLGKKTNLSIAGFTCDVQNPCIVSKEKFEEMAHKTRIEVNFQKE